MSPEIEKLLRIIEEKLDWGASDKWQSRDFENLNQLILEETGISLSASTLRRIWGRVTYAHLPSGTTLDALAKFAGYENWRNFTRQNVRSNISSTSISTPQVKQPVKSTGWIKISWIAAAVVVASLVSVFAVKKSGRGVDAAEYSFDCKPVMAKEIPNSVIFTYDAVSSPTDSVYIQQSWDPSMKTLVDKSLHKHTSVYYEPGFHRAKLIIGSQIVKEHKLIIPTNGWLALIDHRPIPVYLKPDEFMKNNFLEIPVTEIQKKNIEMVPQPPMVKYYNVGNFDPVPVSDFSFSAEIKNEYNEGSAACQLSYILLITDDNPIIIPISVKGCVSDINLMVIHGGASGKKADLSGFGVDFSNWAHVECKSSAGKIQFIVNDKSAYELPLNAKDVHIVGMAYVFQGTGAVKNINLDSKGKQVFHAF